MAQLTKGTPEMAVNIEICKQFECSMGKFAVTPANHLFSKILHDPQHTNKLCLHSYAKEISLETLQQLEKFLLNCYYGLEATAI